LAPPLSWESGKQKTPRWSEGFAHAGRPRSAGRALANKYEGGEELLRRCAGHLFRGSLNGRTRLSEVAEVRGSIRNTAAMSSRIPSGDGHETDRRADRPRPRRRDRAPRAQASSPKTASHWLGTRVRHVTIPVGGGRPSSQTRLFPRSPDRRCRGVSRDPRGPGAGEVARALRGLARHPRGASRWTRSRPLRSGRSSPLWPNG
jgi:hypothetical protein